jgi:hypothetical protein
MIAKEHRIKVESSVVKQLLSIELTAWMNNPTT